MAGLDAVLDAPSDEAESPFGKYEEEAIASLIIDHPEFFANIIPHLAADLFSRIEVKYVVASILNYHEEYQVFPTRGILRDRITQQLTVDDPYVTDIIAIVERKSDPREVPAIRAKIVEWARHRAFDQLFANDTIARFHAGDYAYIEAIFEKARRVQEVGGRSLWFFKELEKLFVDDTSEKFTTAFTTLDKYLNEGGPGRKEMLVWMAPTGVGKSIALINNAIANSKKKKKVLLVTLELSDIKSAIRALGAITDRTVTNKVELQSKKQEIIAIARALKENGAGDIVIHELPPDEVTVDAIYAILDELKRNDNFVPDLVIVDYLELLMSRISSDNADMYTRQKGVSTQLRGLAHNANVCVMTATQTNRGGNKADNDASPIDVTSMAESYGKSMALDYLISINQSIADYKEAHGENGQGGTKQGRAQMYIAKNRNGPKFINVSVMINYKTMAIKQQIQ